MVNNRSVLYWSESGGAKTSQISYLARRVWRQHHKRTRVISADGGSLDPVRPEIEAGLIEPFVVPPIDGKTIAIFRKLSLSWWPDMEKLTKEHKLVLRPPTVDTYSEFGLLCWDGITAVADRIFRDFQNSGMRLGKDDALLDAAPGERGVLAQEAIARMHGLAAGRLGGFQLPPCLGDGGLHLVTRGVEIEPALAENLLGLADRRVLGATLIDRNRILDSDRRVQ